MMATITATRWWVVLFGCEACKREEFIKVVEDSLDSLPEEFRRRIKNVAILVEDFPLDQSHGC
jgi:predicted Zn-dependent protease with MMP-like domain